MLNKIFSFAFGILAFAVAYTAPAHAASTWQTVDTGSATLSYRYGQHVLIAADQNNNPVTYVSYEPLRVTSSEITTVWKISVAYDQALWKEKIDATGKTSKIKGISKELTDTSANQLYAPGTRHYLLAKNNTVYEVYAPKTKNATQNYWYEQMVKRLTFK